MQILPQPPPRNTTVVTDILSFASDTWTSKGDSSMAYSESYTCDVCGDKKTAEGDWWLAWVDCFHGDNPGEEQPLIQLTRWQLKQAHVKGIKHLCGARCAGTMIDRWMSNQHENPESQCETPQ